MLRTARPVVAHRHSEGERRSPLPHGAPSSVKIFDKYKTSRSLTSCPMNDRRQNHISIYTIGHSNRSWEDFIALLGKFAIRTVADIRSMPGSKKFPHFDRENMEQALLDGGFKYVWLPKLGGLRRARKGFESPNIGLTNPVFRAYADYMATPEFQESVEELLTSACESTTAIMCAEALYWRCHRRLVSDYLAAHNIEVLHILGVNNLISHEMTEGAVITPEGYVLYPGANQI